MISRRQILKYCATASAVAQSSTGNFRLKPVKDWDGVLFGALSPDGTKLFHDVAWGWFLPYSWKIIEVGSWKDVYSFRRNAFTSNVSFFDDSERVYVEAVGVDAASILIDLKDRRHEIIRTRSRGSIEYQALTGQYVVGTESTPGSPNEYSLVKSELHSYHEVSRTPAEGFPLISADRRIGVGIDRAKGIIVCRKTSDLSVLWTRPGKPSYYNLSADGGAVAFSSGKDVRVLDGRNGSVISILPLEDVGKLAVSPNGRLLASEQRSDRRDGVQLAVSIHELPSGRWLATEVHQDRLTRPLDWALGKIEFTADGRYLFTCGKLMRAWAIENPPV